MTGRFDVLFVPWDPILGRYGQIELRANIAPLTEPEADEMLADLSECVSDYRGQGAGVISVRKVESGAG